MVNNSKRMLYSAAFSGMLLAAGLSAYAEGEVLISGATEPISWTQFVNVINDDQTVTGDAEAFKTKNPNNSAVKALATAETNEATASEEKETADGTVSTKATELKTAEGTLEPFTEAIDEAEAALKAKEDELAQWKEDLSGYNNSVTRYSGQVTSLTTQLDEAKDELSAAQKRLDAVASTTQEKVYPIWLETAFTNSQLFSSVYSKRTDTSADIWYKYEYNEDLYLSFTSQEGYDKLNAVEFRAKFVNDASKNPVLYLYVDYGKTGDEFNYKGSPDGIELITNYTGTAAYIVQLAVGAVKSVHDDTSYYSSKPVTTYNDPDGTLQKAVTDAQEKVDELTAQRKTANANLTTANSNVDTTQGKIDGYTVTKGEDGKTEQQTLKDAVETAKNNAADAEKAVAEAQKAYDDAVAIATAKATALTTAQNAVKTAKDNVQTAADAAARAAYNKITLQKDITVDTPIMEEYSGTINGNNKIITIGDGVSYAFDDFDGGNLSNAAVNGRFARSYQNAHFQDVASWRGTENTRYYDEEGNYTTYDNLGALGFAARNLYGVDFKNMVLTNLGENTKVYDITVYQPNNVSTQSYVVKGSADVDGNYNFASGEPFRQVCNR